MSSQGVQWLAAALLLVVAIKKLQGLLLWLLY